MNFPDIDKGGAALIAASIAGVISFINLVLTVIASRSQSKLSARLADLATVGKEGRDYKLKQLTAFYDPIYTILIANRQIFDKIGPKSEVRKSAEYDDAETAYVWQKLSDEVVVPNNERICSIIESNLHYISDGDSEKIYLEFVTHAHAYKVFKKHPYEAYRLFGFPEKILESVSAARDDLRYELRELYKMKVEQK